MTVPPGESESSRLALEAAPAAGPAPVPVARNLRLVIEYDGTAYCGWQRQANGLSIQQVLEEAIGRITGEAVRVVGSGRTDAGVHALRQVAHVHTGSRIAEWNLLMGINSLLPRDIAVLEVCEAAPSFHARFDVRSKVYLYRICNRPVRSAHERNTAWFVWEPLDLKAMEAALPALMGRHDFSSFCSTHTDSPDHVRTIHALAVQGNPGGLVEISVEADGFLRYMVRTLIGALVEVGRGRRSPGELAAILAAKDRRLAGITAPPQGLFLKDVNYR